MRNNKKKFKSSLKVSITIKRRAKRITKWIRLKVSSLQHTSSSSTARKKVNISTKTTNTLPNKNLSSTMGESNKRNRNLPRINCLTTKALSLDSVVDANLCLRQSQLKAARAEDSIQVNQYRNIYSRRGSSKKAMRSKTQLGWRTKDTKI